MFIRILSHATRHGEPMLCGVTTLRRKVWKTHLRLLPNLSVWVCHGPLRNVSGPDQGRAPQHKGWGGGRQDNGSQDSACTPAWGPLKRPH